VWERTGRTDGDRRPEPSYRRHVKLILVIAAVAASTAFGGASGAALARTPSGCVVPRLFALTPAVAQARLEAAGCTLGGIAFERPHARVARVTGQVPAPGAALPRRTRVSLLVS
jgi:hypothetical protein